MEGQLFQPILEGMKLSLKESQKKMEKEMKICMKAADTLKKKNKKKSTKEEYKAYIDKFLTRVKAIKHAIITSEDQKDMEMKCIEERVNYLNGLKKKGKQQKWFQTRLNRMIVDHMMREGQHEAAKQLAKTTNIESLVDLKLFKEIQEIERDLEQHCVTMALAWCKTHHSKMTISKLEFELHAQAYIQLVIKGESKKAIEYARTYLSTYKTLFEKDIHILGALLAFPKDTTITKYATYYAPQRWTYLQKLFRSAHYALYARTHHAPLKLSLQAGMTALHTPMTDESIHDPLCHEPYKTLVTKLPYASPGQTHIYCRLSAKRIDEDNPLLYFPQSGQGYSKQALKEMAQTMNGYVVDPISKERVLFDQLKRAYLM
eukprot:CAMPEP_0117426044 /NCGR_PEP_ID=MMETSP0758-20121206/6224_1 /TAXON_ID=63605 /ORGANISM="Percolomonas cosmopolitus, Strain AE-1 (ATCC 50343)" /LENGTH=373 /DNA_ID=CAMNT_0005210951 /DNA_START=111 /DNA_END=1232 /DNA_ORIENTATION=+